MGRPGFFVTKGGGFGREQDKFAWVNTEVKQLRGSLSVKEQQVA